MVASFGMIIAVALALLLPAEGPGLKLKVGDQAPSFSLPASNGTTVRLADFRDKRKVVLAFFPKAFTGVCSREMAGLRDHQSQFDDSGAQVLGISLDRLEIQTKFADSLKLPFPLLSDRDGKTAAAYGVKGALWAHRTTFVIDERGRILSILEGKDAVDPGLAVAACRAAPPLPSPSP